ncbi:MAG: AAA family ATPase [Nitrospiraceae bacterium]|nr:AAA family ATPase [Nitrospiraceae bacterium]
MKAIRLVDYLLRLATLRTKLTRDISEYEKVLWISDVPQERSCFTQAWGPDEEHELDEWMEVTNRREPELPTVPHPCKDWVNPSALRNKDDLPELFPEITRQIQNPDWWEGSDQPETIPHTERLEDHQEVSQAWNRYVEGKWLPWTEEHNSWEKVHKIYCSLFAIHQAQLRLGEEYELVHGVGLLTWQTPTGQRVRRHIVVADAILDFEARLGKFTVRPHPDGAKLRPELDMLDIEEQPTRAEETAKASLAIAEDDLWDRGCVEGVLQVLAHSLNSEGVYDDSLEAKNSHATAKPIVEFAPALILRRRTAKGLTETLQRIREQLERGQDLPREFADLAEMRSQDSYEPSDRSEEVSQESARDIFFPKPSNEEQRRIVEKIQSSSGVLVQGPPGTGKSHTIANLICHLLATGRRTLITAKTPRALQVLERLVPEELRPLCINLLGSGLDERRSLESSVGGILRKNDGWSTDLATLERTNLENNLRALREERTRVNRRLRDIRESETHTQSIAGGAYRGTAARIAEAVNRDRSAYEWFMDSIPSEKACHVSTNDLLAILEALRRFPTEKREELALALPEALPSTERFTDLVRSEAQAIVDERLSETGADEPIANLLAKSNSVAIESICATLSTFRDTRKRLLSRPHSWMNEALRDITSGDLSLWHELLRVTKDVIASIEELVTVADNTSIDFPGTTDMRTLLDDARKLNQHLQNGGSLGWGVFRPKPVKERLYILRSVKVGGRPCSTVEHFSTLVDALHVRIECGKAWGFWEGRTEQVQGPYALQLAALKSLREALENALAVETLLVRCREALKQCPDMHEPTWADEIQVGKTVSSCRLALARIRKRLATEEIHSIDVALSRIAATKNAHPVVNDLLKAIRHRDGDGFARCINTIQELKKQQQILQKTDHDFSELRGLLPHFMKSLEHTCSESHWETRIRDISAAWQWAQARHWIEDYIRQEDAPALAKRAKQIDDEINGVIAKLAAIQAWAFCFQRMEEPHRRHMEAWCKHVKSLTKTGKGKRDFRNRQAAQRSLNECKDAVPAWIMPLHRVWDTVDPTPGMFDVIIVDEASQCGFEALPLLYLGKKILIVGDDKQISPSGEFQDTTPINKLLDEYLYDFNFKEYFDVNVSLFEHGKLRYGTRRITLREHFRCMPEIIRFSNDLCYSDTPLIPLRQYGPDRLPPLRQVFVDGGHREGSSNRAINRPEAEAIVEMIRQLCGDRRYDGKTMGIVVLQGEAQAALIEHQLLERLGAEEVERRRLVCGNPYSFQGDERDIMFLSLVAASNERIGALTKPSDERRFNVAASRARDQMILFHSLTSNDLSASCLRRRLLEFFESTAPRQIAGIERDELERRAAQDNRRLVSAPAPFESWFEVDVALELLRKNFTVLAQYEFASKRIDLVVEGGQARLAVECDGDQWHGSDRYETDMQRQRQLERCGWEFFRVREAAFYANKANALLGLWGALDARGILPNLRPEGSSREDNLETRRTSTSDFNDDAVDDGLNEDESYLSGRSDEDFIESGRRPEEITAGEIQDAIIQALRNRPNLSCTLHSLTTRVLKELGVMTRGKPREAFERRTMRSVSILEKRGQIETYKAKNRRLRLLQQEMA